MSMVAGHMLESLKDHVLVPIDGGNDVTGYYLKQPEGGRMMSVLIMFTPEGIVIHGDLCPGQNGIISCYGYGRGWFADKLSERYLCEKFLQQGWHREVAIREIERMIERIESPGKDWEEFEGLKLMSEVESEREERESMHEDLVTLRKDLKLELEREGHDPEDIKSMREEVEKFRADLQECRNRFHEAKKEAVNTLKTLLRDVEYLDQRGFYDAYHDEIDEDAEHLPGWDYSPSEAGWLIAIQKTFSRLYQEMLGKEEKSA